MSGGSMNYVYARISDAAYYVHDKEIKELLIKDLSKLLHDLEWYESGDYGKDTYLKSLAEFKKKWFKDESLKVVKEELYALVGDDLEK